MSNVIIVCRHNPYWIDRFIYDLEHKTFIAQEKGIPITAQADIREIKLYDIGIKSSALPQLERYLETKPKENSSWIHYAFGGYDSRTLNYPQMVLYKPNGINLFFKSTLGKIAKRFLLFLDLIPTDHKTIIAIKPEDENDNTDRKTLAKYSTDLTVNQ